MIARNRIILVALTIGLFIFVLATGAPLMFPLTFGGFNSDTVIQGLLVTPNQQKLLVAFQTADSAFVDTSVNTIGNFYTLFDYPSTKDYLWSKQYSSTGTLSLYLENMDFNADESKGCVLYSTYPSAIAGVVLYDLMFFNMADGLLIRQFQASSINFDVQRYGQLFFYNTKVYFMMYDSINNKIGYYIWNEIDIPTVTLSGSLVLGFIYSTTYYQNFGFVKGSAAQNYIVFSHYDAQNGNSIIQMMSPAVISGQNSFTLHWKQSILSNNALISYLDLYETAPDNRYIFGCGDRGDNSIFIFRMLSVNTAEPNGSLNPEQFRIFKISEPSSSLYCRQTKALSEVSFIVAVYQVQSSPITGLLLYKITIDDVNSSPSHLKDYKQLTLTTSSSSYPYSEFLGARIFDWDKILLVENNIYNSNTATVGYSISAFANLPIIKTTYQAESVIPMTFGSSTTNLPISQYTSYTPLSMSVSKQTSFSGMGCQMVTIPSASLIPLQTSALYNNQDTCLINYGSYTSLAATYYIYDTTFTDDLMVNLPSYFSTCNTGTCATERLDVTGNTVPTLTIGISNGIMSVFTSDTTLLGNTYTVFYRAVPPPGSLTNCVYSTEVRQLTVDQLTITTSAVSTVNYNFLSGPMTFSLTAFSQSTIQTLPKFDIVYTLKDQTSGLVYTDASLVQSQFIIGFTNSGTPTVTIDSMLYAQIGSYSMRLEARFAAYNPTYSNSMTFTINIVDTCSSTVITPNNNKTFYHLLESGPISYEVLPQWTDSYNGICGTIQHSILGTLPSIIAFSTALKTFTLNPKLATDAGSYQVKLIGKIVDQNNLSNVLSSATSTMTFVVISLATTFLTPQPIVDIYYYVGDPLLKVSLSQFLNSDSKYSVLYNVTTSTNQALDSSIIGTTAGTSSPYIQIYATSLSKVGTYGIQLLGYYNLSITYNNTIQFNVIVQNKCVLNLIQSKPLLPLTYTVGSSQLFTTFNAWTMNQTSCGPILKYEIKLQSGLPNPPFLSFDGQLRVIGVQTSDAQYTGTYQFIVSGLTKFYSPDSQATSQFDLTVACNVKTITRQPPSTSWKVQIGTFTSQSFDFGKLSFDPDCPKYDPQTTVTYDATMNGAPLPSYLTYDINQNQFVISASPSLVPGPVGLGLKVTVMKGSTQIQTASYTQNLVINPQSPSSSSATILAASLPQIPPELVNAINLPTINLQCKVGETKEYTSPDFAPKLINGELYSLVNPKQVSFISLSGQQVLRIKPTEANQGLRYRVFLKATDVQSGQQYLQTINIEVESTLVRSLKPLTADIIQISRTGLVDVKFSHLMLIPTNLTLLDKTYLTLRVKDSEQRVRKNDNFTWNVTSFKGSIMQIKVYFQYPLNISVETSDWLEIEVIQNSYLMSIDTSEFFNITYQMRKKIPNQLDPGSQFLDSMSQSLKEKLGSLMSSSAGSATTAFILNRIWGMVNSVQLVMLLPLGDVKLPANIHLTTQSIQSNTQHEILKALSFDNFEFKNTTPFSKEFEEQGYDSFYVIDNLRPIYKNINMFSMLTVLLLIVAGLIKLIMKREIKLFETVKNIIVFNFLIKLVIENSLQLSVFSLVNLQESLPKTKNEIMSMAFAAVYLSTVVSICAFNWLKVRKLSQDQCENIIVDNPTIAVLYQLLDRFNKRCLYYFSVFIARRMAASLIYVTLKDHQEFQMHLQLLLTLSMILYLTRYPPYDSRALNIIELTNEWVVLACQYCMMTFMFELESDALRNKLGLGFSILVIIQLVASFIALLLTKIIKAWPAVRQVIMKIRNFIKTKCAQRKAQKEQKDFSDLQKVEDREKEKEGKRGSDELLETDEQFVDDINNKKNGLKKTGADLDTFMPHNLDLLESPPQQSDLLSQTTDNRNYSEWAKNPGIQLNQAKNRNPIKELDYSEQFFGKNIFNSSQKALIQQHLQNDNSNNIDSNYERILKEYRQQQSSQQIMESNQQNEQNAKKVLDHVNEALEYFTSQNVNISDPRQPFYKQ